MSVSVQLDLLLPSFFFFWYMALGSHLIGLRLYMGQSGSTTYSHEVRA